MAFNNFNNQRQMFPQNQGNFGQMPNPGQQMGAGFQPNQSFGVQGFPQQGQQFPGYQMGAPMGPQMNPQMRPHMGHQMGPQMQPQRGTQMGLQIGAFHSNVQLGHQFPKQQQIRIEQQRKQAEENMKKQEELMKKKEFEAKQRKIQQSFTAKKATSTDALDSLFGKKGSGSVMSDLIGPLGKETTPKTAATKTTSSVFSRPGGSVSHHSNLSPGQWGSGFMTSGQMTPQGTPASGPSSEQAGGTDDFGEFSQGPSFPGQGGNDGDAFSDFQEAPQPATHFVGGPFPGMGPSSASATPQVSGGTNVLSPAQSWHGTTAEHSRNMSAAATPTTSHLTSFPQAQNMSPAPPIHGVQTPSAGHMTNVSAPGPAAAPWSGPSNVTQGSQMSGHFTGDMSQHRTGSIPPAPTPGGQMTQFTGNTSRTRTGSIPDMMPNALGNVPMPQPGMSRNQQVNMGHQGGANLPSAGGMHAPPTMGPHGGGFGSGPTQPGAMPVPSNEGPTMQHGPVDSTQEPDPEVEVSPERKLELLYGVTLPDWCTHGTDLPGIYKEIADKTTDACDAIDTNKLFPILMASDLPRNKLGHIWNRANLAVPGQLNLLELRIVLGLVALGQAGIKTERLTLEKLATCKAAPIPTIPEDVLQTKGRGWSFTEPSQEGSQSSRMAEGDALRGRYGSSSSEHSIDPNDKYSVFRAVDQPEVTSIAASPSMDSKNSFGAFQGGDQPVIKPAPPDSDATLFQGGVPQQGSGWNTTQVSSVGGPYQSFTPNKPDEFGDFQGQAGLNNKPIPVPSTLGPNLNQKNDLGDFQSETTSYAGNAVTDINQKASQSKDADFANFQAGVSATSSGFDPSANVAKPEEDDFGDFQAGKESGASSFDTVAIEKPKDELLQKTAQGFGNFQVGGELPNKATAPESANINLFSKAADVSSSTKSISNINIKNVSEIYDFGDFQHSPGPLSTRSSSSTSFTSESSEKLASSLEKFKLSSNSLPSAQGVVKAPSLPGNDGSGKNLTDVNVPEKQEFKPTTSNFASFPVIGNDPSQAASTAKTSEDKYSAFRDVDFGSGGGVFDAQRPATKTEDQTADDEFADFGGFEGAEQSGEDNDFGAFTSTENTQSAPFGVFGDTQSAKPGNDSDFGAFTSTENTQSVPFGVFGETQPAKPVNDSEFGAFASTGSDSDFAAFKSTDNAQSVPFGAFGDSQPAQHQPTMSSSKSSSQGYNQDFGDFNAFGSTNPQPKKESSGEFGSFGSFVSGPASASSSSSGGSSKSHSHSTTASDSLINSVSLEPSARYKVLSHDSGDMDQHANAWSRCLNSCLLTLATATLAIQKMTEQSVKEEVLASKEGATYFSAIVEIYRVTLRIKTSVTKSAPNNSKLKGIHQEIESTWKNIANFLNGSAILPSPKSLDFTMHHVSATENGSTACGICLLNVDKSTGTSKQADGKLMYGGRQYHNTCANFWCNRVDSVLPSLLPIDSLI